MDFSNNNCVCYSIIYSIHWFFVERPRENKKEKQYELKMKKERRWITTKLNKRCYFCGVETQLIDEEVEDNKKEGLIPLCFKCNGKLEEWERIK